MTVKRNDGRLRDAIEVCRDPCRKVKGSNPTASLGGTMSPPRTSAIIFMKPLADLRLNPPNSPFPEALIMPNCRMIEARISGIKLSHAA